MEINDNRNYWIIEFIDGDEAKWKDVLNYILPLATHVEFNILYSDKNLKDFLKEYESSIVEIIRKKDKIYSSGKILRMRITDQIVEFLEEKNYSDFKNWFLEDPSFYINDQEVVATISHEDQIYLDPKHLDPSQFTHFKLEHKLFEEVEIGFWERIRNIFK